MENLQTNLAHIHERIEKAASRAERKSEDIKLLLATKTIPAEIILQAFSFGELLIGENRVQELLEKYEALSAVPHTSHFIGRLQTNKIKSIVGKVSCVESVDNLKLAEKLNERLLTNGSELDIFIEVNTSGETSKNGCKPDETVGLVADISKLKSLHIKGLMTIGALTDDEKKVRNCFVLLRELREKVQTEKLPNVDCTELSMGMSSDFEWAIAEGATEIRIGSAIFGARPKLPQ